MDEMVSHAIRPEIGAVGAMLYYPNDTIQHAGIILGLKGLAGHAYQHQSRGFLGQQGRARCVQNFSALTGACLAIEQEKFNLVSGFDEVQLTVAYSDIDLCLKLCQAGFRNVWTPFAELYHHESATRAFEDTPKKKERFQKEVEYFHSKWGHLLTNDPAYNPNLSLINADFSLAFPPRLDKPWRK
jgi:GT2 family glycosyltransferase